MSKNILVYNISISSCNKLNKFTIIMVINHTSVPVLLLHPPPHLSPYYTLYSPFSLHSSNPSSVSLRTLTSLRIINIQFPSLPPPHSTPTCLPFSSHPLLPPFPLPLPPTLLLPYPINPLSTPRPRLLPLSFLSLKSYPSRPPLTYLLFPIPLPSTHYPTIPLPSLVLHTSSLLNSLLSSSNNIKIRNIIIISFMRNIIIYIIKLFAHIFIYMEGCIYEDIY